MALTLIKDRTNVQEVFQLQLVERPTSLVCSTTVVGSRSPKDSYDGRVVFNHSTGDLVVPGSSPPDGRVVVWGVLLSNIR